MGTASREGLLGEAGWVMSFFYEETASFVERRAGGPCCRYTLGSRGPDDWVVTNWIAIWSRDMK
jgi:hypothetical protein